MTDTAGQFFAIDVLGHHVTAWPLVDEKIRVACTCGELRIIAVDFPDAASQAFDHIGGWLRKLVTA